MEMEEMELEGSSSTSLAERVLKSIEDKNPNKLRLLLGGQNATNIKAAIDVQTPNGTALCIACSLKETVGRDLVGILLEHHGDITQKDNFGLAPLHIASQKGDPELVKLIVKAKPNEVDIKCKEDKTPLHLALRRGDIQCAELLLTFGGDCKLQDNEGNNGFHMAAFSMGHYYKEGLNLIHKMLIQSKDAFYTKNYRGCTPSEVLKRCVLSDAMYLQVMEDINGALMKNEMEENQVNGHGPQPKLESLDTFNVNDFRKAIESNLAKAKEAGLIDANLAGGPYSRECTLIITEGKSATSFARSGIAQVNQRDVYGIFPLNGKVANVRGKEEKNKRLMNIIFALGLPEDDSVLKNNLRYGHIMILTDQDMDGAHIKGLIMNFFQFSWPDLLKLPSFIQDLPTYLIKAYNTHTGASIAFKSLRDCEEWKCGFAFRKNPENWDLKYYKGLAGHKSAKEYFLDLKSHLRIFYWGNDSDRNMLDLAFNRNRTNERKVWISQLEGRRRVDYSNNVITYGEFVKFEVLPFFNEDLKRSIPCAIDGLKPSQRKVLFTFLEKEKSLMQISPKFEIKVSDLSGIVSQVSAYHHANSSLDDIITRMAQDCQGTNNINLLEPYGQFGTKREDGLDVGSGKYISTWISNFAYLLFKKEDCSYLTYLYEDGQKVEPSWYAPILPMVLVNGAKGIGTGYSTSVPNYNPMDLSSNIKCLLRGENVKPMIPWYNKFKGEVVALGGGKFSLEASYTIEDTTVRIIDVPPGYSYDSLEKILATLKKHNKIKHYERLTWKDNIGCNEDNEEFVVTLYDPWKKEDVKKMFKLSKIISTSSIYLYDEKGCLRYYNDPEAVLKSFYGVRYNIYEKRKHKTLATLKTKRVELEMMISALETHQNKYKGCHRSGGGIWMSDAPERQDIHKRYSNLLKDKLQLENEICKIEETSIETMWTQELIAFEDAWKAKNIHLKSIDSLDSLSIEA